MLDFARVRKREITMAELTADLTVDDLRQLTDEMVDTILDLVADSTDEEIVFVPSDPDAHDAYAADEADVDLAWTLGHVIVHVNASCEESAALAAELARGVEFHGRSRSEVPWQTVTTVAQCRRHLEQSRRICLASLQMWPDEPHLENFYQRTPEAPKVNAIMRYVFGLSHADSHLEQIKDIVQQARESTVTA